MKALPTAQGLPGFAPQVSPLRRTTLLCLAALNVMAGATIAPSLPALQTHFAGTPDSELASRLVLTLPGLFIALCAPIAGAISDRCGRLRLLFASVLLYALAGLSGLLQDSLAAILVGRALLGVAVAGTMTSVTALAGDYFPAAERERYMAQQGAFISFGGVVFLVSGGWLADLHWRAPFAVYGIALALLPAAILFLYEPPRRRDIAAGAGAAVRLPHFVLAALFLIALAHSLTFYLIPTQLPFLLRDIGIARPSHTGLAIAGGNLMGAISSLLLYRPVGARLGPLGVFAFSFTALAAGMLLISVADSLATAITATAVYGIGMGTMMPHLFTCAIRLAPPQLRGRVAGGLTTSIFLGQFLSPLLTQHWIEQHGFASGFAIAGLFLLLLAAAATIAARWPRPTNQHQGQTVINQ
ncbi:MFS transporter [Microbulbifer magnicolonia]|uniref:MFS transporter n=1 Tax=Microbulbifer magnicolonia TaxID=3109744 RepID=UPI002B41173A|nr:MFS transporter [Microbulbifer sp. GG15]